jgi:hypothetical protein
MMNHEAAKKFSIRKSGSFLMSGERLVVERIFTPVRGKAINLWHRCVRHQFNSTFRSYRRPVRPSQLASCLS